jgi:hypothetical protein
MGCTKLIQFAYPWESVRHALVSELAAAVEPRIKKGRHFCSITLPCDDPLVEGLLEQPIVLEGRSLIRLVRDDIRVERADLDLSECFELIVAPDTDSEVRLSKEPSCFYELSLECRVCGRWSWIQTEDLQFVIAPWTSSN